MSGVFDSLVLDAGVFDCAPEQGWQEALTTFLLLQSTSLVGDRITWDTIPQGQTLPAVVLTLISSNPLYSDDAAENKLIESLVQVDVWGLDYDSARTAARSVFSQLSAVTTTVIDVEFQAIYQTREADLSEFGVGDRDLYRVSMDFRVWHEGGAF